MSTAEPPVATPSYRDQSAGLIVFGILQILIGCCAGLMGLFMLLSAGMARPGMPAGATMGPQQMIPAAGLYLAVAVAGVWLGSGSIAARRWAWALTVVLSWIWLICGVGGLVFFALIMLRALASVQAQAHVPPQMALAIQIVTGSVLGCIYIVLPAAFLLFYQRAAVRATCQWRDPQIRWTDRCPLPVLVPQPASVDTLGAVATLAWPCPLDASCSRKREHGTRQFSSVGALAVSVLFGYSALWMPMTWCYNSVMPLFGTFVSGPAGTVVTLLMFLLLGWLAWGIYRLKMGAWWGAVALCIVGTVSATVTFAQPNAVQIMYEKMGFPPAQLEMMHKMGMADYFGALVWIMPAWAIVMLGYLVWVRRYFKTGDSAARPASFTTP